jgi:hypothetical protein
VFPACGSKPAAKPEVLLLQLLLQCKLQHLCCKQAPLPSSFPACKPSTNTAPPLVPTLLTNRPSAQSPAACTTAATNAQAAPALASTKLQATALQCKQAPRHIQACTRCSAVQCSGVQLTAVQCKAVPQCIMQSLPLTISSCSTCHPGWLGSLQAASAWRRHSSSCGCWWMSDNIITWRRGR